MEGYSMKRAQYIQRGQSGGSGYLPAPVHMRTQDTRRVIGLTHALVGCHQKTEVITPGRLSEVRHIDLNARAQWLSPIERLTKNKELKVDELRSTA